MRDSGSLDPGSNPGRAIFEQFMEKIKLYQLSYRPPYYEISGVSIVDLFVHPEPTIIKILEFDIERGRLNAKNFGINFGDNWASGYRNRGDRAPFIRGFEYEEGLYEINKEKMLLIKTPLKKLDEKKWQTSGLFYDAIGISEKNISSNGKIIPSRVMV